MSKCSRSGRKLDPRGGERRSKQHQQQLRWQICRAAHASTQTNILIQKLCAETVKNSIQYRLRYAKNHKSKFQSLFHKSKSHYSKSHQQSCAPKYIKAHFCCSYLEVLAERLCWHYSMQKGFKENEVATMNVFSHSTTFSCNVFTFLPFCMRL